MDVEGAAALVMTVLVLHPRIVEAERTAIAATSLAHELMRRLQEESWRAFMDRCYHCEGTGALPLDGDWDGPTALVKCPHCDGSGDLDGARLRTAYDLGRADALGEVQSIHKWLGDLTARNANPGREQIKRRCPR